MSIKDVLDPQLSSRILPARFAFLHSGSAECQRFFGTSRRGAGVPAGSQSVATNGSEQLNAERP